MTTPSAIVEAFSVTHAQIMDGAQTFQDAIAANAAADEWDVYGVNEASLEPDTDQFQNEGDNVVLSSWAWLNFAELSVQAGYVSFPLIANLTNRPLTSSGSGSSVVFEVDLWHEDSMNVPPRPMIIVMPSKDHKGNVRTFTIGLYRAQFSPITFDGPAYKDGLKINYGAQALYSTVDETGATFPDGKKRIAKMLSTT